ncbi:hypothetical protein RvY_18614 [Ramazzottius varieornatus]|uniref:Kazal-like domain-containing protein n=1 Tax=Ramazzottius varieornatus TaxID=947166 RepID=A0A1D1WAQ3_RAMVA|nr:hypothetical protein RvY_18614 [Ramazzottius varieornatus]
MPLPMEPVCGSNGRNHSDWCQFTNAKFNQPSTMNGSTKRRAAYADFCRFGKSALSRPPGYIQEPQSEFRLQANLAQEFGVTPHARVRYRFVLAPW